jgi:hypothetical protein
VSTESIAVVGWRRVVHSRWPWIILLLALALGYYGSYLRYGIGFRDEGQTVALLSQRLLKGEVPIRDVVLSYNVGWFWPVVALYKIFGVSYVLLRGWCFALSTLTAVLGFLLVAKTTRRPWLAFLVATVLVLIPGSQFKNYIPLLAVANTLCLLHVALTPADTRHTLFKSAAGGVVLGLSFLIRIDIALLFTALWLMLLLVRIVTGTTPFLGRSALALASLAALMGAVALVHLPALADARRRGYEREFAAQYAEKWRILERPVTRLLKKAPLLPAPKPVHASGHFQPPRRAALPTAPAEDEAADKGTLRRATLADIGGSGPNVGLAFVFLTYAPLLALGMLVPWGLAVWVGGIRRRDGDAERRGLGVLVLVGGALTTFPQFFFFRPDIPHLSEFMPGFLASAFGAAGLVWKGVTTWRNWRTIFGVFLAALVATYIARVLPDRWAGTYAIRNKRTKLFVAENGVRVFVTAREDAGLHEIQRLIRKFAPNPADYIACYPYSPGINLLADRPTYEKNVYIDNAIRTTNWDAEAIARFEKFRPAVVVLSDWDINGTRASRFSVWAVKTKTWLQTRYIDQGTYIAGSDAFQIFTREAEPVKE